MWEKILSSQFSPPKPWNHMCTAPKLNSTKLYSLLCPQAPDFSDKHVFGIPLSVMVQRTGQPLPQCVLYAMRYLRRTSQKSVGIFRKSGVKSKIQQLRDHLEENPGSWQLCHIVIWLTQGLLYKRTCTAIFQRELVKAIVCFFNRKTQFETVKHYRLTWVKMSLD